MKDIKIDTIVPNGEILAHRIFEGQEIACSVVIAIYDEYIEVLHIFTEKKFRRKGYAKVLLEYLKKTYDYIITGWIGSEPEGRELFLGAGFEAKNSLRKKYPKTLEWKRGKK